MVADVVQDLSSSIICFRTFSQKKKKKKYQLLKLGQLFGGKRVGLGDDRDEVGELAYPLHGNNVERGEGMPGRLNKIEGDMDARVLQVGAIGTQLVREKVGVLLLDVTKDRHEATQKRKKEKKKKKFTDCPFGFVGLLVVVVE